MTKRFFVTLILLTAVFCSALEVTYIDWQNYGSAATRIVIGLYGTGDYKVDKSNDFVEIKLDNADVSKVDISNSAEGLIKSIEQFGDKIVISTFCPYCLEQMELDAPRRLVLDLIVAQPDKQQKIELADFYTSVGKLNSADKIYSELHRNYPSDYEILYKWACLLKQRGSGRLKEIVGKIPEKSEYYSLAQQMLKGTEKKDSAQLCSPQKAQNACKISSVEEKTTTDSLYIMPKTQQDKKQTTKPAKVKKLYGRKWISRIMLLIILMLLLILIYHFIASISRKKRKTTLNINIEPENKEDIHPEENNTLCLMVRRLLDFGWTNSEIAKELKISEEEVERLVQLCNQDESQ